MKIITRNVCATIKSIIYAKNCFNYIRPPYRKLTQKMTTEGTGHESIPKVDIDPTGVFKYILIKVFQNVKDGGKNREFFVIVRGYQKCDYHSDIYDEVLPSLKPFDSEPYGGGRISHEPEKKRIKIYGYSQGYGKADHEIAAKLIKEAYPGYSISISNDGY